MALLKGMKNWPRLSLFVFAAIALGCFYFLNYTPTGLRVGIRLGLHSVSPVGSCFADGTELEPWEKRDLNNMFKIVETGSRTHRVLNIQCSLTGMSEVESSKESVPADCFSVILHWEPLLGHSAVSCPDKNGQFEINAKKPTPVQTSPAVEVDPLVE